MSEPVDGEEPTTAPPASSGPDTPRPKILAVDDHEGNLLALELALKNIDADLVTVRSGEQALIKLLNDEFAVVLMDVQMPTMNGFEAASLIRSRRQSRHLPIIFITAFSNDSEQILEGYGLGAVDFLFKPLVPEMLQAKVSVFLELHRRNVALQLQSEQIREHERREHDRRLEEERARWKASAMENEMREKSRVADELARRAHELARVVDQQEKTEQELQQKNDELADADRRKDEFIAMLAHELRNPLAPLTYALELISRDDKVAKPTLRAVSIMNRQLSHMTRLIDDLLDVSRVTSGKIELQLEPLELRKVIDGALDAVQAQLNESGLKLELSLSEESLVVSADAVRLTQVIGNLLSNAIRYTPRPGTVKLSTFTDGDSCVVQVADTGQGLRPDSIKRIFEPFVQERAGNDGLGLGLAVVKKLVELHGGTVEASSEGETKGTMFTVRLATCEGEKRPKSVPVPEPSDHTAGLSIAVVEDQPDIRDTLEALLCEWGHSVVCAADGAEGLELLLSGGHYDVALIDLGMPKLDGFEVAHEAKRALGDRSPTLVAVSGYGQQRDRDRAREAGFDHHLVKPVMPGDLQQLLNAVAPTLDPVQQEPLKQESPNGAPTDEETKANPVRPTE